MTRRLTIAVLLALSCPCHGADQRIEQLLDAIESVETGGLTREQKKNAVGDNGKSRGPYQISYAYYLGASGQSKSPASRARYHRVVKDKGASRALVLSYWQRYAMEALRKGDAPVLCSTHNGGPRGHLKASTKAYWPKVKAALACTASTRPVE